MSEVWAALNHGHAEDEDEEDESDESEQEAGSHHEHDTHDTSGGDGGLVDVNLMDDFDGEQVPPTVGVLRLAGAALTTLPYCTNCYQRFAAPRYCRRRRRRRRPSSLPQPPPPLKTY